jgi:hypothetical protein
LTAAALTPEEMERQRQASLEAARATRKVPFTLDGELAQVRHPPALQGLDSGSMQGFMHARWGFRFPQESLFALDGELAAVRHPD